MSFRIVSRNTGKAGEEQRGVEGGREKSGSYKEMSSILADQSHSYMSPDAGRGRELRGLAIECICRQEPK
jgi:hypothetical protein